MTAGLVELIGLLEGLASEARIRGSEWENPTIDRYLEALAAWLTDHEGFYQNWDRPIPDDPWIIMADAVRAATMYE